MVKMVRAAAMALILAAGPLPAAAAPDQLIIVDVAPVSTDLARHLQVAPNSIPPSVDLPDKVAAVVCKVTLKQLREGGGRCVAVGMSQNLIQAVRSAMRGG